MATTEADPFELQQHVLSTSPELSKSYHPNDEGLPESLHRAQLRMQLPPSYILVGVYRLFTDKSLWKPAWDKCKHGTQRGLAVGLVWAVFTFAIQEKLIKVFLNNSPRIIALSNDTFFGFKVPISLRTYAALVYVGHQLTYILKFFLSKNIRIARDRAWSYTVASRGKGDDFWKPYVEEWENPPRIDFGKRERWSKWAGGQVGMFILKRALVIPTGFYPLLGPLVSAWFKALGTAHFLHRSYFEAKKMSDREVAVFMEEKKWDYRMFGFAAALLEGLPVVGLVFTISNRIGAAMWAFDLEKRQHFIAAQRDRGQQSKH